MSYEDIAKAMIADRERSGRDFRAREAIAEQFGRAGDSKDKRWEGLYERQNLAADDGELDDRLPQTRSQALSGESKGGDGEPRDLAPDHLISDAMRDTPVLSAGSRHG